MKRLLFIALIGCRPHDAPDRSAEQHLRSIGYTTVHCESEEEHGVTACAADGVRFRCAIASENMGCRDGAIACERYLVERPMLEKKLWAP